MAEPSVQGGIHSVFWNTRPSVSRPPSTRLKQLPVMACFGRHLQLFEFFGE